MTGMPLVVEDLVVEFLHDGYAIRPLDHLSFTAHPGELVVLLGPSGSGKTTLLSCLGGILTPTSGRVTLDGDEVSAMSKRQLDEYRRTRVGFVFQSFNLIPSLNALQNVAIPLIVTGTPSDEAYARAGELLDRVGLGDRMTHHPSQLSGGQQQRVAVARGLAQDPPLLLADEPTANLDHIQAEAIIRLLRDLRDAGRIIVVSTHDARLVPIADRVVQMGSDAVSAEGPPTAVTYAAGELIFSQGDEPDLVYVIEEGEVDILRLNADGTETLLATIPAGQYFGELGPLLGFPRSASARARTATRLTSYGPQEFRRTVLGD
jgi:putative ABC transport system ATP-binding protein